jgi:hypothetical protein
MIAVSYIIAALVSCNFIIKNYVNRKITSYIYLLIFTKSIWLHVKHFITLTERESVRRLPLSTHRPVTTKNTGKYDSIGDKKKKKVCVRIKRVKTDSYLTTANRVKHEIIRIKSYNVLNCNNCSTDWSFIL